MHLWFPTRAVPRLVIRLTAVALLVTGVTALSTPLATASPLDQGAADPTSTRVASRAPITSFTDAGRSVACALSAADESTPYGEMRCDLIGHPAPVPLPPRPGDCPVEWAATVLLDENEVSLPQWGACVGDSIASGPARPVGQVVRLGVFECTVLASGVRCLNSSSGYGFVLSPATFEIVRPEAKSTLTANGIAKLRLGMTTKQGKATGQLGGATCDQPQLKKKLQLSAFLSWRKGKLTEVFANESTNIQARKGVGIGSTLAAVQGAYPTGTVAATTDEVAGRTAFVFISPGKRGKLVFLLQTAVGHAPSATTPVDALWAPRSWNPRKGYAFSGC